MTASDSRSLIWYAALITLTSHAQMNAPSTVPGSPRGFNYPMSLEATVTAPKNHRVLYEDDHVRLLEVTLWPNDREPMHGHPRPSVFALDALQPQLDNPALDTSPAAQSLIGKSETRPGAAEFPYCISMAPQAPHAAKVLDPFPQRFHRMEYKRLDAAEGFDTQWRSWYPDATKPNKTKVDRKLAGQADKRSLTDDQLAPGNYKVLFKNDHLRFVEALIRPGETTPLHGSPYYAVLAFDTPQPGAPDGPPVHIHYAQPDSPLIAAELMQWRGVPEGWSGPSCVTVGPQALRTITNNGAVPIHYYRFEFTRVDGREFADKWKTWYPEIANGPPK